MSRGHTRRVEARRRRLSADRRRRLTTETGPAQPVPVDQLQELARRRREQDRTGP